MEVEYKQKAIEDRDYWKEKGNLKIQQKISKLINDICEHPFTGLGKPEPLKYELAGLWSRHITRNHRIIYEVLNSKIIILSMKGHY
jgi:toxin YoeB